ncbi:hypothetical protein L6452_44528 [Arctium lappa]|uniref:Uncharacterized protein n=1 Tax=Arctium lappa TaxID=4217 RepID=A0ACB8XFX0_ARCLA|nr:hypothetical protein L6452_44528 [Arctium lappa]
MVYFQKATKSWNASRSKDIAEATHWPNRKNIHHAVYRYPLKSRCIVRKRPIHCVILFLRILLKPCIGQTERTYIMLFIDTHSNHGVFQESNQAMSCASRSKVFKGNNLQKAHSPAGNCRSHGLAKPKERYCRSHALAKPKERTSCSLSIPTQIMVYFQKATNPLRASRSKDMAEATHWPNRKNVNHAVYQYPHKSWCISRKLLSHGMLLVLRILLKPRIGQTERTYIMLFIDTHSNHGVFQESNQAMSCASRSKDIAEATHWPNRKNVHHAVYLYPLKSGCIARKRPIHDVHLILRILTKPRIGQTERTYIMQFIDTHSNHGVLLERCRRRHALAKPKERTSCSLSIPTQIMVYFQKETNPWHDSPSKVFKGNNLQKTHSRVGYCRSHSLAKPKERTSCSLSIPTQIMVYFQKETKPWHASRSKVIAEATQWLNRKNVHHAVYRYLLKSWYISRKRPSHGILLVLRILPKLRIGQAERTYIMQFIYTHSNHGVMPENDQSMVCFSFKGSF